MDKDTCVRLCLRLVDIEWTVEERKLRKRGHTQPCFLLLLHNLYRLISSPIGPIPSHKLFFLLSYLLFSRISWHHLLLSLLFSCFLRDHGNGTQRRVHVFCSLLVSCCLICGVSSRSELGNFVLSLALVWVVHMLLVFYYCFSDGRSSSAGWDNRLLPVTASLSFIFSLG